MTTTASAQAKQRQIVLDTETTGIDVNDGHRVIEIGCVEMVGRRPTGQDFWQYLNPERLIDEGAMAVHGITNERVANEPRFGEVAQQLYDYLCGAELIIHNASFDVGFLDAEFRRVGIGQPLAKVCTITDTLAMAKRMYPGQKASLDALCRRLSVDNSNRDFHGALLDARLLADVYLLMTGGQSALSLAADDGGSNAANGAGLDWEALLGVGGETSPIVLATDGELAVHRLRLEKIAKKAGGKVLWGGDFPDSGG